MPRPLLHTLPLIVACCALLALWTVRSLGAGEPPVPPKAERDLPPGQPGELRTVVVAGGCFWCEEAVFEQLKGVTAVVAGYAGGTATTATYEQYEESNHAEAVKITYDSSRISYGDLLRVLFAAGEPTVKDGAEARLRPPIPHGGVLPERGREAGGRGLHPPAHRGQGL